MMVKFPSASLFNFIGLIGSSLATIHFPGGGGLYCSWESMTSSFLAPGGACSIGGSGEESGKE